MRTDAMPIVDIAGSPYQRGRAHGEALRPQIAEMVGRWSRRVEQRTGAGVGTFLDRFLADTDFRPAIARWTPDLEAEIRGIAEGAGQPEQIIGDVTILHYTGGAPSAADWATLRVA